MKKIIICEKPSVARTIASYLGKNNKFENKSQKAIGYMENNEWVITWCFGHLVTLSYPEDYDSELKKWSLDTLPFLPANYKYRTINDTKAQFNIIKSLYHRTDVDTIMYCPDPAREGVLIQYLVRMMAGARDGIDEKMMWIDSITEPEVMKAIRNAKPVTAYENIRDSGLARSIEDFAIGINYSRALSVKYNVPIPVGRVMTCVLGMVVRREREIANFVPTSFYKVRTNLTGTDILLDWKSNPSTSLYKAIQPALYNETGFKAKDKADAFVSLLGQEQIVANKEVKIEKKGAPLLFNLTELQATCSRMFKVSPKEALDVCQSLYEKKLLTYPRTDARVLSEAIADEIGNNISGLTNVADSTIANIATNILSSGAYRGIKSTRYVDDSKIEDHYAIIPTGYTSGINSLTDLERDVYLLVAKRFLSIFMPPAEYEKTSIVTQDSVRGENFYLIGSVLVNEGYLAVAGVPKSSNELPDAVKNLKQGDRFACSYEVVEGQTQPPKHYTTGSMVLAMENAGNLIEDEELRSQIKGSGIGTSATRAATIDKLVANKHLNLSKKTQVLTVGERGDVVYEVVNETLPELLNPELTAKWEQGLSQIVEGTLTKDQYLNVLNQGIVKNVDMIKGVTVSDNIAKLSKEVKDTKKKSNYKVTKKDVSTYLSVPFAEKDEVKKLGARFDGTKKSWFVPAGVDTEPFAKWLPNGKATKTAPKRAPSTANATYINVPYAEKDEAKSLGARFDANTKKWYVPAGVDVNLFSKWFA